MNYQIGQIITGTINGIQQYGIFVKLDDKTEGLIHISEIKGGYVEDIGKTFHVGEKIKVMILDIDPYSQQISLSHRAVLEPEKTTRKNKVHFWTSLKVQSGFKPVKDNLEHQIDEGLKRYL